jgi:putative PEP-CTERM system histidine kinase
VPVLNTAAVSYGLGGIGFVLLTALMLTTWRGRLQGGLLVLAAGVSAAWCLAHVGHALYTVPAYWLLQVGEVARDGAWFAFLLVLLGLGSTAHRTGVALRVVAAAGVLLAVGLVTLALAGHLGWSLGLERTAFTRLTLMGHLGLAIVGLVLVHQLFRDTRAEHRWALKFLVFGLGGLFAYDLYMYSHALLYNRLDTASWVARGLVNATVVPFVAVAARRNPTWSVEVFVSRQVVFHSTALLGVGVYLMLMAGAGYYIRLYGGSWGGVIQLAFLFLALLLLAALLLSGQARARLKVFLSKHFFKNKYDYREEWLKFNAALSGGEADSAPRDNIVRAFAAILEAPRGVMWVRQSSEHFQPAAAFSMLLPGGVTVRPDSALVRFLERTGWVVYLEEFQREPGRYAGLVLPDWITTLREPWVIVPLLHAEELVAFIILARPPTPRTLNWEDSDLLKACGRQAASFLALLKVSEALADARQFEAFNRLSAYVVHDLKNLVAQLSLVVSNARRHMHSPGFIEDAVETVDNAAQKMNRLLTHLRKGRVGDGHNRSVNLVAVMQDVVRMRAAAAVPAPRLDACAEDVRVVAEPDRLASVMEHLVQNAQDATPAAGSVTVRVARSGASALVEVADTGCGMDPQFISDRLFRPFDTTKGNAGMGVGVYESREFVLGIGGSMDVQSTPGQGTVFRVQLPLEEPAPVRATSSSMETDH